MKTPFVMLMSLTVFFLTLGIITFSGSDMSDTIDFNENYRIDLKQGGYEVYRCHDKKVIFVKRGDLEDFFLRDNL